MDAFCKIAFGESFDTLGGEFNQFVNAFDFSVN